LTGFVYNDTKGVTIELQGEETKINDFIKRLNGKDSPPLAHIEVCMVSDAKPVTEEHEFIIRQAMQAAHQSQE